jgi:hypothetical protein
LQLQRRFALKDRLAEDVERVKSEIEAGLRVEVRRAAAWRSCALGARRCWRARATKPRFALVPLTRRRPTLVRALP